MQASMPRVLALFLLAVGMVHAFSPAARVDGVAGLRMKSDSGAAALSRRNAFRAVGGVFAAFAAEGSVAPAGAEPSAISAAQGPLQDQLAPGHWFGQFLGVNCHTETWAFESSKEEVSAAFVEVMQGLTDKQKEILLIPNFDIVEQTSSRVHVLTWTKVEWLDALDVRLADAEDGGCVAKCSFYATGFLPTIIPGAPLFNVLLSPLPFASPAPSTREYPVQFRGGMLQKFRVGVLKELMAENLDESVQVSPRGICNVGDYSQNNFMSCWTMMLQQETS